jgi:hypothetical protein
MTAVRKRLPNRRTSWVTELWWNCDRWHVSYSRDADGLGRIREVFLNGAKTGSAIADIAYSTGTTISIALQYGVPLDELAHSVCRLPDGSPADLIGAVLDHLIAEDRHFRQEFPTEAA